METDLSHRYRIAAFAPIAAVAAARLVYLANFCPFDLSPDEAYYWDWSRQLDWSYHSKGPLVAWLIRLSCELFGDTMFAVRLPAVICGSLLLVGLYDLTVQVYRSDRLGFAVVALALTLPIVSAGAMLMTIDAPFACAWMWALVFGYRALFQEANWAWSAAGICILLGVLAKHTMVLWLPSFALFLLTTPSARFQLRQRGFWMMAFLGALGGVPILVWNMRNGWVTLNHARSHAGFESDTFIHVVGPLQYLGAQCAVLLGFWFVAWARAMWRHRPTIETRPELRFLWWMSAPTFVFFGLFAFKNGGGEANWPIVSYLAGMVLAAGWLRTWCQEAGVRSQALLKASMVGFATLGLLLALLLHQLMHIQPVLLSLAGPASEKHPLPIRRVDPTSRLRGWRHLADEVDQTRTDLRARGIEPVLAAERWTQAGELRFYCYGHPDIYCLGLPLGDRDTQYDLWRPNPVADPDRFTGRTFLLVGVDLGRFRPAFSSFEPIRIVQYQETGVPVAEWSIVVAHGFRGWGKVDRIKSD